MVWFQIVAWFHKVSSFDVVVPFLIVVPFHISQCDQLWFLTAGSYHDVEYDRGLADQS